MKFLEEGIGKLDSRYDKRLKLCGDYVGKNKYEIKSLALRQFLYFNVFTLYGLSKIPIPYGTTQSTSEKRQKGELVEENLTASKQR